MISPLSPREGPAGQGLGALIRRARLQSGLSKRELAERLTVPMHTLALWEDPAYEGIDLPILRRVARATGGSLELRLTAPRAQRGSAWKDLLAESSAS